MCGASRTLLHSCNQGVWEDLPQACLQDCTGDLRFDDPLVERAVRVELGIVDGQPIPQASAKQVRKLVMGESLDPSEQTGSLGGVECLAGLEALGVLGSAVTDLAPLAPLGNLKEIWLEGPEELTDLSLISHLRSLVLVHVRFAGVTDVMPLTKLTGLVNVGVPGNQIRDLQPLLLLRSLAAADLEYNPVDCSDPTQQAVLRELRRVAGVNQAGMRFEDFSHFGGGPGPSFWSPCPASDSP